MPSDKELYRQLRELTCLQLEEEIRRFDRATPRERLTRVSLIRAVGVVFAAEGTPEQRDSVRGWLRRLLKDPEEKIRRYAMTALPKLGAGRGEEGELLTLLQSTSVQRERKFLGRALNKIGGEATLKLVTQSPGLLPQTDQKVQANLARQLHPSSIRLDATLANVPDLRIQLRCRRGLESIVRDEAKEFMAAHGTFRLAGYQESVVTLAPTAPFSLADLYSLRCFATVGFVLGTLRDTPATEFVEAVAAAITAPRSRELFHAFTEGSLRYRMDFIDRGHQRGAVARIVERAYALCPEILNDASSAPWSIDIHPIPRGVSVELRPKLVPDPRLGYRQDDIPAASHPPLAAAMARVAGPHPGEVVWDPFCGSGLELIERALLGGVKTLVGTDVSGDAIAIARANVAAAALPGIDAQFFVGDFREHAGPPGLGPQSVSLVITNPPMGRRVRIANLRGLIADLFAVAATVLRPGGRLVFANPLRVEPSDPTLQLRGRQTVDLGGFDCRLELYEKVAPGAGGDELRRG